MTERECRRGGNCINGETTLCGRCLAAHERRAAEAERASLVAWLRDTDFDEGITCQDLAHGIESGEHQKEPT